MPPGAQGSSVPARALADGLGPDPVLVDKDAQGAAVDFNARSRKASRNIGLPVIVSARALKVDGSSLSDLLHQDGMRPQPICQSSS